MSYELSPLGGSALPAGTQRRVSTAVARMHSTGLVRQGGIDVETDVVAAKIDAVTLGTARGMQAVAHVAQAQTTLEQLVPAASDRLNVLADAHTLAVTDIVGQLTSRLRRL